MTAKIVALPTRTFRAAALRAEITRRIADLREINRTMIGVKKCLPLRAPYAWKQARRAMMDEIRLYRFELSRVEV